MAVIRDPRHQRLLAKDFDIRQGFVSPELEPSIQPVTIVSDLEKRDDYGDAPYFRRAIRFQTITGDATHPPQIWLTNPSGSQMLLLVRKVTGIVFDGSSSATISVTTPPTPNGNTGAGGYLNRRTAGSPVALVSSATNQGPVAHTLPMIFWPAGSMVPGQINPLEFVPTGPVVLVPGGEVLLVDTSAAATTLSCSFHWDEVPFEP